MTENDEHGNSVSRSRNPPCPYCGGLSTVESEPAPMKNNGQKGMYRRRRTYVCSNDSSHKFFTDEALSYGKPMMVRKKDGRLEPFEHSGLLGALAQASTPSHSTFDLLKIARKVTDEAYSQANAYGQGKVIASSAIGRIVLDTLRKEGRVAMWVRFSLVFHGLDAPNTTMRSVLDKLRDEWNQS